MFNRNSSTPLVEASTRTVEDSHIYASPETYTATVTVKDKDSGSGSTEVVSAVVSAPATAHIPSLNQWSIIGPRDMARCRANLPSKENIQTRLFDTISTKQGDGLLTETGGPNKQPDQS